MAVSYTSRLLFMALRGSTIPFPFLVNKRCVIGEPANTNCSILGGIRMTLMIRSLTVSGIASPDLS